MMAGGASSRFFPENKVFSDPTGCGRSMVQQAYDRLTMDAAPASGNMLSSLPCCATRDEKHKTFIAPSNFYCVTGPDMADEMKQHLPNAHVLAEPGRRNTLPAILWTMANVEIHTPDGTLIVVTGDHVIRDIDVFRSSLALACEITDAKRAIVTVGIKPNDNANEWTAFGAIKSDKTKMYKDAGFITKFEEKPSFDEAEGMIKENCWAWNSGMFVFKMALMRELLEEFQPEIHKQYTAIVAALKSNNASAAKEAFLAIKPKLPDPRGTGKVVDTSIDYAIMMRLTHPDYKGTAEGFCIPGTFYWMDIGSWNALRTVVDADANNNVVIGDVILDACSDIITLNREKRKLTVKGTKGIIVVAGSGWVLICKEDMAQAVKEVRAKALECADPVVCENCELSNLKVSSADSSALRVAAVGIAKGSVEFSKDGIVVSAE